MLPLGSEQSQKNHEHRIDLSITPTRSGVPIAQPVHLQLSPGELICLTGENGVGKTTLLQQLAGIMDESPLPEYLRTFYLGHGLPFYPSLAVAQQLRLWTGAGANNIQQALSTFGVSKQAGELFGNLSKGQQQRVALSMLCLGEYDLWLLDEPLQNLDAQSTTNLHNLLCNFLQHGGMAVVATHHPPPAWENVKAYHLQGV